MTVVSLKRCSRTTVFYVYTVYTQFFLNFNIFTTESRFGTQHRLSLMKLRCFNCDGRDLGALSVVFDILLHMFSILTYFFVCRSFSQTVCCCLNAFLVSPSWLECCVRLCGLAFLLSPVMALGLSPKFHATSFCFAQLARLLPVLMGLVCLLSGSLLLAEFKAAFDWDLVLGHFFDVFSGKHQPYAYFISKIQLRFFLSALFSDCCSSRSLSPFCSPFDAL